MKTDTFQIGITTWASKDLPARLDVRQTAQLLGFAVHDIAVLMAARLLIPLGDPAPNAPKWFAAVEILGLPADVGWLSKATKEVSKYWRYKRERRGKQVSRDKSTSSASPGSVAPGAPSPVTQSATTGAASKAIICFVNGFREIRHPAMTVQIPKARNRAYVLKKLHELWELNPGETVDWEQLAAEAGYSGAGGFFRTVEDRNRPDVGKVLRLFVEEIKTPGKGSRVRLNPRFDYQILD